MFGKKRLNKMTKTVIVLIFAVTVVVWSPDFVIDKVKAVFFTITYPAQKVLSYPAGKVSDFVDIVSSIEKLKTENVELLQENLKLKAENAKLQNISKENDILRKELELLPRDRFSLISSQIIGGNFSDNGKWFLIDRGSSSGIKKGMPVIVNDGILVGKVAEVFSRSSKIVTVVDIKNGINATTLETGARGIIKSKYGLGVVLDMVLQTDYLKVGDKVITSEISQDTPSGLLIGEIKEVRSSDDQLFQTATVSVPIDYSKLKFVFVLKNEESATK